MSFIIGMIKTFAEVKMTDNTFHDTRLNLTDWIECNIFMLVLHTLSLEPSPVLGRRTYIFCSSIESHPLPFYLIQSFKSTVLIDIINNLYEVQQPHYTKVHPSIWPDFRWTIAEGVVTWEGGQLYMVYSTSFIFLLHKLFFVCRWDTDEGWREEWYLSLDYQSSWQ